MNLPSMSVKNPVTTLMIFLAVLVVGFVCFLQMPVDLFPKMEIPALTVVTLYGGASPEDVESKISEVLEEHLSTVSDVKHITSVSREGVSMVTLEFEWETDLDTRANEIRDAVGIARMFLPDDADDPRVFKIDFSKFPILVYGISAKESYPDLEKLLKDNMASPLEQIPGVAAASVRVPLHRQVNVYVDRERLSSYSLTMQELVYAINQDNKDIPAGSIKMGTTDYMIRVPGEYRNVVDMESIVVGVRGGVTVRLGDVASVEDGFDEVSRHVRINGNPGGIMFIQKESGANTVKVAREVKRRMDGIMKRLPPDIRLVNVMDLSEDVERMINDLSGNLIVGGLMAMAVVLLFLREWRSTVIIGLTIPFSLVTSIVANFFLGYTINMMTLFGLIIAVGMVVDNAIVVLENIARHREEGERYDEGSIHGTSEVAMAIAASTLTTLCIFFPVFFVKGMTRIMLKEFAIVVSITLISSLFSALTLTPMLASRLMRRKDYGGKRGRFFLASGRVLDRIGEGYASVLGWALGHKKYVIGLAVALFVTSLAFVPFLGREFMPDEDRGMLQGRVYLPVGTRVEYTADVLRRIDAIIREEVPPAERVAVYTSCGKSERGMEAMHQEEGTHVGTFGVKLVSPARRARSASDIAAVLRRKITREREAMNIEKLSIDTGDPIQAMMSGNERPVTVHIIGNDMEQADRLAVEIRRIVERTPGAVDARITREYGKPELWMSLDRARAAQMGFNATGVGDSLRNSFYGSTASKFRKGGDEYDVIVRYRESDRAGVPDLSGVPLRQPGGAMIRSEDVADMSFAQGPVEIQRKDQGRIVSVTANIYQRSLSDIVGDVEKEIARIEIPSGIQVVMGGQTEDQREAFFWLELALVLGMILVYMVMASQFESLKAPFVVMFSIPFAFTGAIWALVLLGHNINIVVFIGLLLLIGVVVNNAIVLVDYIGILRARGFGIMEAVKQAGRARLRPVLMTALTTMMALIPMAFGRGQGAEVWNPLGATVLGGMLVSTAVTMVLVPTIYAVLEGRKLRLPWRGKERAS